MGLEFKNLYSTLDMKFLVVLSLAVAGCLCAPEAEAEADAYYGAYGYGLGYHGLGYHGLGYHGLGYRAYGYGAYGHYYGKRSADAEPQILGYPGLVGGVYGGLPAAHAVVAAETPAAPAAVHAAPAVHTTVHTAPVVQHVGYQVHYQVQ